MKKLFFKNKLMKPTLRLCVLFLFAALLVTSLPLDVGNASAEVVSPIDSTAYIGTIFYDDVPVLTAGGGYKFYSDAECAAISVGGNHEITYDTNGEYALFLKADPGYTIKAVRATYPDGADCGAVVTNENGIYKITLRQDSSLTDDVAIHVDVALDANDLLKANSALLTWKAKGESGSLTFTLDGETYSVFDTASYNQAYDAVFSKLWDNAVPCVDVEKKTTLTSGTYIWKVSGDANKLDNLLVIREGVTVILLCEEAATIKASRYGKIALGGGVLSVQGKNDDAVLTFDGARSLREHNLLGSNKTDAAVDNASNENLIQIRYGNAYFDHVTIKGIYSKNNSTGTQGGAMQLLPYKSKPDEIVHLYVSDVLFTDCQSTSGGAFSGTSAYEGTEVYFYQSRFENCQTSRSMNNVGGGAVRAGSGSGLYTFHQCDFINNKLAHTGSTADKGYNAGGAIRWNIGSESLHTGIFNDCTFSGNTSVDRGGAIMCTGGMQLNSCELSGNSAKNSGGAVFVAAHTQNTASDLLDLVGTVIFGPGTKIYNNRVENLGNGKVDGGGLGGAIHFKIGISKASDKVRANYELLAKVDGAEIYGNSAEKGGAIAVSVTHNYDCGVYVYEGSSIHDNNASKNGGAVYIESNGTYSKNRGFYLEGGTVGSNTAVENGGAVYLQQGNVTMEGGTLQFNHAENGGAVYLLQGNVSVSNGFINGNISTENGGAIYVAGGNVSITGGTVKGNTATQDGGATYLGGGELEISGGEISGNKAQNGAGALVANGDVTVSGGIINGNEASVNGGGVAVTNGDFTMVGGTVSGNKALSGDGGGIYVSSQQSSAITIRSGAIINNHAGKSGGALGVHGQNGVGFTITLGENVVHASDGITYQNSHAVNGVQENCPIIENNTSVTSGGGIYLSGSYEAKMNIYCLKEHGNSAESGVSKSNFMKVEGGSLLISSLSPKGDEAVCGNVVINSSVHVTGGQVTLQGKGNNPLFNESITVDIEKDTDSFFKDLREKGTAYSVQYFENFESDGKLSGQYISIDVIPDTEHTVRAALYSHTGFAIDTWVLMTTKDDGTHIPTEPETSYKANDKIKVSRDIILYAKWVVVGYTVKFEPGVTKYEGTMSPQDFEYNEVKALNPNAYINEGYSFVKWVDKETLNTAEPTYYVDAQQVTGLANEHGAEITLVAVWELCLHNEQEKYTVNSDEGTASITVKCPCLAYTETATLRGQTVTYREDKDYPATLTYTKSSSNGEYPTPYAWNLPIVYDGVKWDETRFDNLTVPHGAGKYTASVTKDDHTVTVAIIINKAEQSPPNMPTYSTAVDGEYNVIQITAPTDTSGKTLEYLFSWYDDTELKDSEWQRPYPDTEDPNKIVWPSHRLNKTFTNYYVDVRYAEDDNYLPSVAVRGETVIFYTGNVIVHITSQEGMYRQEIQGTDGQSGITVVFTPYDGYYLYNITANMSHNWEGSEEYTLPLLKHTKRDKDEWHVKIDNIQACPGDANDNKTVSVYIHFTGVERVVTVETSTVKGQVFTDIGGYGESGVTISGDSAYTVQFDVNYYAHYSDLSIKFGKDLPANTTVIMLSPADGSYWTYRVTESTSSILLSRFKRMGSDIPFDLGAVNAFTLQFVVDFSQCENETLLSDQLSAYLTANGEEGTTVPSMPAADKALSKVTLVSKPDFSIETDATEDPLTQNVTYRFAYTVNDVVGISKWQNLCGILVVTPNHSVTLPKDVRLQVKIGNSTDIYSLIDGKFIVALPGTGDGTAAMTLLSDMFPSKGETYTFTVELYASRTDVDTTPYQKMVVAGKSLTYTTHDTEEYVLHAEITDEFPKYEDGNITPVKFAVEAPNLPANYTVRAVLYSKNENGVYFSTTQTMDLTMTEGKFEGTMNLDSLAADMNQKIGSLSLMLRIEIVDPNGKAVSFTPLYFVLIDSRQ